MNKEHFRIITGPVRWIAGMHDFRVEFWQGDEHVMTGSMYDIGLNVAMYPQYTLINNYTIEHLDNGDVVFHSKDILNALYGRTDDEIRDMFKGGFQ